MLPGPKGKGKFKVVVIITEEPGAATVCQWRQALPLASADYRDSSRSPLSEVMWMGLDKTGNARPQEPLYLNR